MRPQHLIGIDIDAVDWKSKDQAYWTSVLTPEQFRVCRAAGTERPFSGEYCKTYQPGAYGCICCGRKLFDSQTKFDSGTGWPSFDKPVDASAIRYIDDKSHGMVRTEVRCGRCDAHLGHVFEDGPTDTGRRYCINSVCLFQY